MLASLSVLLNDLRVAVACTNQKGRTKPSTEKVRDNNKDEKDGEKERDGGNDGKEGRDTKEVVEEVESASTYLAEMEFCAETGLKVAVIVNPNTILIHLNSS